MRPLSDEQQHQEGPFELRVSLGDMRPEDALRVILPPEQAGLRVWELLDSTFSGDPESRSRVEETFDLRDNPDLPEIYAALLHVFDSRRMGRCVLDCFANRRTRVADSALVVDHLDARRTGEGDGPAHPVLDLVIEQKYHALDYAVAQGYWDSSADLLEWLRPLTLLYFLDKHEFRLPAAPAEENDQDLLAIAGTLQAKGLIAPLEGTGEETGEETGTFAITELGRRTIGSMMAETESYIDRFDVFKDTAYDADAESVEFDKGRGEDLRVQIFIAEGLDPVRVVFLLRLYDGTLDEFAGSWPRLVHNADFFEGILEPVVDRDSVDEALIDRIIESGYAYVEEREEAARELRSQREILERMGEARGLSGSGGPGPRPSNRPLNREE
jgi:hypothetical protein